MIPSSFIKDDRLARAQYFPLDFFFRVDSGAASLIPGQPAPLIVLDANGDSSQSAVNTLLEVSSSTSTSEIDYATACGSTAMGVDSVALVIACSGQIKKSICAQAHLYTTQALETGSAADNTDAATIPFLSPVLVEGVDTTVPPNTLTSYLYKTPAGNLFARFVIKGFDAASSGKLHVRIWVELK